MTVTFEALGGKQMSVYTAAFRNRTAQVKWQDHMITQHKPGHTKEASVFPEVHAGRETAGYYSAGIVCGGLEPADGLAMLQQLQRLQNTDRTSAQYGGFRWYREETRINDTNAAFFIMSPLTALALLAGDKVPDSHRAVLMDMMEGAREWFTHECKAPILYYPNKIISDGALLLALAKLTGHEARFAEGVAFFERWLDYTHRRGWGWGENISLGYLTIIVNSLQIAAYCLHGAEPELCGKLLTVIKGLLELVRFHDGEELVPTIRSYNFQGEVKRPSIMWELAGLHAEGSTEEDRQRGALDLWMLTGHALFRLFTQKQLNMAVPEAQPIPRIRRERVMDNAYSYTWIGRRSRLGSLNKFPVLEGCYQWPTWGLGWQSFPVSFSVAGEQVGFLRWTVTESGALRAHPAESQPQAYLNPALFAESHYPDVETRSVQSEQALLVVRSLSGVNNRAAEIVDEWLVHRFRHKAELHEIADAAGDVRTWAVLRYPGVTVAIAALSGITAAGTSREAGKLELLQEAGGTLRIRCVLYSGAERTVVHPRLESAWAVVVREENCGAAAPMRRDEAAAWLRELRLVDVSERDGETPRAPHQELRRLALGGPGLPDVSLTLDPHGSSVSSGGSRGA